MSRDQKLLAILGVSCQALDDLIDASLPLSYGAKLTGAGGGGSMVALTDRPDQVAEVIRRKGGYPIKVKTGVPGVKLETSKP
jgi:mevalonate kinase